MASRFPILCYHSLDNSGSPISVSPAQFRWQMEHLRSTGWRSPSLDEFLDGYPRGEWQARTCLLTFDDGFENFATDALPPLMECGFQAIVFVVSNWVGKTNDWQGQWRDLPRSPLMDWNKLSEIVNAGIEIGAHSLSHPRLSRLPLDEAEREIVECKRAIEDQLGCAVQSFAYPYGESSPRIERIVSNHFRVGMGTQLGFANRASRATIFERIDVYYLRQPRFFRALSDGWLLYYLHARQWIRNARGVVGTK